MKKSYFLIAGLLQLLWGVVPSASSLVIHQIPVEAYIALRSTLSSLVLLVGLYIFTGWRPVLNQKTYGVGLLGIFGYAVGSLGTLYGLKLGGVTNFALVGSVAPMITAVAAIFILNEKPRRSFFWALPLSIFGIVLVVVGKHQISNWKVAAGSSVLIFMAYIMEALVFVYSSKLKKDFSSLQYLAISQFFAALFMWSLQVFWFRQFQSFSSLTLQGWMAALFVSLFACLLCYAVLYWLLNHIEGHRLALFDGLHTFSAVAFGVYFFSEKFNLSMCVGGLLILFGIVIGNMSREQKAKFITKETELLGEATV
jgi:drug/metabolite transporter (DMT)-like permease